MAINNEAPTTLRVGASISAPESTTVDQQVVEVISNSGPPVVATILEHMGAPGVECVHDETKTFGRTTVYSFTIKSPVTGGAFIGVVDGNVECLQTSANEATSPDLDRVTPASDSTVKVKFIKNKVKWSDGPLFWKSDSTEFHVTGEGFETLCRYLSGFASEFDTAKFLYIASHIDGIQRGGEIPMSIHGDKQKGGRQ